jgi:ABC-type antimicrobial peptide transport system permease subunit
MISITLNGLKTRLSRAMVTAAGILLGIAFLSYVLTEMTLAGHVTEEQRARQWWLVVMALLTTTVGIANAMLMSVTERFREIGTMKCLGALDSMVVKLFIIEAIFIGIVASIGGWLLGWFFAILSRWSQFGWYAAVHPITLQNAVALAGICTGIGALLTLVATIAPAIRAAEMPAAAALRTDV